MTLGRGDDRLPHLHISYLNFITSLISSCPSVDLGSCKFYGAVKSKKPDTASGVDGNDDGGEVSVFVWEGAERRRDGQTCIKRLKVGNEIIFMQSPLFLAKKIKALLFGLLSIASNHLNT